CLIKRLVFLLVVVTTTMTQPIGLYIVHVQIAKIVLPAGITDRVDKSNKCVLVGVCVGWCWGVVGWCGRWRGCVCVCVCVWLCVCVCVCLCVCVFFFLCSERTMDLVLEMCNSRSIHWCGV